MNLLLATARHTRTNYEGVLLQMHSIWGSRDLPEDIYACWKRSVNEALRSGLKGIHHVTGIEPDCDLLTTKTQPT